MRLATLEEAPLVVIFPTDILDDALDNLESSMYGAWYTAWFGTKKRLMFNTIDGLACAPCFNKVKASYNADSGRFLVPDLRAELSGDDLTEFNLKIAQLTAQCR